MSVPFNADTTSHLTGTSRSPTGSQKTFTDHDEISAQNEGAMPVSQAVGNSPKYGRNANAFASTTDEDGNDTELGRRQSIVQELAREYTRDSAVSVDGNNMALFGSDDPDSPLNPNGKNFSAHKWARTLANVTNEHGSGYRTAGFAFQDLNVFGYGKETDYQKDVGNVWLELPGLARELTSKTAGRRRISILRDFNGVVEAGEMLVVLGPPGSGCSTFLKTITGDMDGIYTDDRTYFNYQGLPANELHEHHAGDAIYTAEVDVHFPQLSVGDTLTFASRARCPRTLPLGISADQYCDHLRDVVMAMYGISHTVNTRVGNEYIRGVSGGERKRVSIAEATLSNAPLQCWDNSTRGLDSANAVEFCKTLRLQSEMFGQTCAVSIYQAPQRAYDLFDKVLVLYEGRQIFFGRTTDAKQYFINLGFECPARQTTPDFLTSMTASSERVVRPGWEFRVPRTPDEFAACWNASRECQVLKEQIEQYKTAHPLGGPDAEVFRDQKRLVQAKNQLLKSPFILSYGQQVQLCLWRGFKLLKGDPSLMLFGLIANSCTGLVMSSLFYNLPESSSSFYGRSAVIFVAILANAFSSALEVLTQYVNRPIVEKQRRYAFYQASAEAFSSVLVDIPYKVANTICYDLVIYFLANLNRQPGNFFFFLFTTLLMVFSMSGLFRSIASLSRTLSQAMVPSSILIIILIVFTGFVVPVDYILGWCRWIYYLNPVAYGFESLMINEFHNREFPCDAFVPSPGVAGYENTTLANRACSAVGAVPGRSTVNGDAHINSQYKYFSSHKWRNIGILFAFTIGLHTVYFLATDYISARKSKGEVLVFRRGVSAPSKAKDDPEASISGPSAIVEKGGRGASANEDTIQGSTSIFHWGNVCYDIKIKTENRRILHHVDGWVKPGTLTALMGVSGAGKTSLLDCLADRVSTGVITGEMLVDGNIRDESFQRKTGYVQQQDLHLETSTVREALEFSALLRQPATTPKAEKLAYVDEVIKLLEMQDYAEAVVGVLGEGLNVEQRKRLSIGVELAAKPPLLLFVDEPTSGLDSQTSWAILDLLEKLSKAGQSILCTIHQPSAMLFQRFDRLLFLAKDGKTVYFGDIGENSHVLTSYFERNGATKCPPGENPAEWILTVVNAAPGSTTEVDWHQAWKSSPEYQAVQDELQRLKSQGASGEKRSDGDEKLSCREFAAPLWDQFLIVTRRVFQEYWRMPSYIYAKFILCSSVALFIGLVFLNAPLSIQGLQNQMFAIFNILSIFSQLVQQQMPQFVAQRVLYEVRERPSKTYSWKVFMLSQIVTEIFWSSLISVFMFVGIYYPVGLYKNGNPDQGSERAVLMWLLFWQFLVFACTFAHACISFAETSDGGGNLANVLYLMCLLFCGVLASPEAMPGFWIFMYRLSPFTYLVSSILSTGLANSKVTCYTNEYIHFSPPGNDTCGSYMSGYIDAMGGYLENPTSRADCKFCSIDNTNAYLTSISSSYDNRWRDFGIGMAYIVFNIAAALGLYWLVRVPKGKKRA